MKNTISFGKVDAENKGRKRNEITVDIELRKNNKGQEVFSVSADVWNNIHTDIIMGGQCLDSIYEKFSPQLAEIDNLSEFEVVRDLWKKYHLNDMHAGTPKQEEALKETSVRSYEDRVEYLKSIDLYEVPMEDGSTYKYGHAWLYEAIPEEDLKDIKTIIEKGMDGLKEVAVKNNEKEIDDIEIDI